MTNKKLLLLIPIVALSLTLGLYQYQSITADNSTELISDFREDMHALVFTQNYTWENAISIRDTHESHMDTVINQIEIDTNRILNVDERNGLKDYILREEIKFHQNQYDDSIAIGSNSGQELNTNDPELGGYFFPTAFAASDCKTQPKLMYFKQSRIDIKGGSLDGYTFEGKNKLKSVDRQSMPDCSVKYTLTFKDEDHPYLDKSYDNARDIYFKRTADIETFFVQNGNEIQYPDIWSDDKSYTYLKYGIVGQHAHHTGDFDRVMYVANTWNHAMDTENTNPDLRQKLLRFR